MFIENPQLLLPPEPAKQGADALPLYLFLRDGTYYFKRKYPAAIGRNASGRLAEAKQVWKSLSTDDLSVALKRLGQENQRFEQRVARALSKVADNPKVPKAARDEGTTKYLMPEHIPYIISRYEYGILQTDDEHRKELTKEERAEHIEYLEDWIETYRECCAFEDFSPVEDLAGDLLSFERLIAPPESEVKRQFLWELMNKDIELAEAQLARARGKMHKTPARLPPAPRDMPTLMDLYEAWAKGQSEVRTRDTYLGFVDEFESLYRAIPVVAIDHDEHGLGYRDYLASCELMRETVRNRIGGLATLLRYGMSEGLVSLDRNPFDNIKFDMIPETPAHEQRRSYDYAELRTIFESPMYTRGERAEGQSSEVAYWGPLLGMFAGPRIEELCQLRVEDIQRINGEWAIRIADLDPQQHLKASGSYRLVPIHQELVACGFLDFVENQKRAGHQRVFHSLKNDNKYKRFSNAYGKWHSAFLDRLGLDDERLCFHSYRFSFKQQLGICGATDEVKDALTGHWLEKGVSGKGYMRVRDKQYPFPILVEAIGKLRYDEVDLQHLHFSQPPVGQAER
ncbi:site-specific integrase [Aquabacterium sp. OR-4]|uniref:site-specific integrase n=1 Tax=Aquabacterium sp. OR-4 TaxID=2978127 RepID=UPI0028C85C8D|nr:site-specific integrase [Aquabacterium sp. OR-4]MDT7836370.1 site-specific integrase [Aquabacterium sp. OR-4]